MKINYTLHYNDRVVTTVGAPEDATDEEVRAIAIAGHDACPTIIGAGEYAPFEVRSQLRHATIKAYPNERHVTPTKGL